MRFQNIRRDKVEIYLHLIWTTWNREPLISPALEADLFPLICEMVARHGGKVVVINGVPDHVHLLIKISATTRVCDLIKDAKGTSSRLANEKLGNFKWRPTYAAFSVSRWNVAAISDYIRHQKEHHANGSTRRQLESEGDVEIESE